MTNQIQLTDAAKFYAELSHQMAAFNWLEEHLDEATLSEFAEIYRADPKPHPKEERWTPAWLKLALKIIKKFEGCRLEAYQCPAGVWTIGYGTTQFLDSPVKRGDTISARWAEDLLRGDVKRFGAGVMKLLPGSTDWPPHQIAALTSFAYNVGLGALEDSTLRKRLLADTDPRQTIVKEELLKWVHAGNDVLIGLLKRREAEIELFCNDPTALKAPPKRSFSNPLKVTYYTQRDSQVPGQASRMCFSSSCAMMVSKLRPELLGGRNGDDVYLRRLSEFGDSTNPHAHIQTLASYKIEAKFIQDGGWSDIASQINHGVPVPCGFYHHGPSTNPTKDGGHWLCVIGFDDNGVTVHDPWGELDCAGGVYLNPNGESLHYSKKNWGPRWLVDGGGGWMIKATR